ncbi:VirB3 family type IV secretion system protein [Salmonella enterica]|nr:VirB3 family type IV secretion system protein [Salmonella enterica]
MSNLFKGMTRPATIRGLGVPVTPFIISMAVLFIGGHYVSKVCFFLMPVAYIAIKMLFNYDEHIFSSLWLKYKTRGKMKMNRYYGATHFSGGNYDETDIKRLEKAMKLNQQAPITEIIPYSSHVTEIIMFTKRDDFTATWHIGGNYFECEPLQKLKILTDQLNTLIRSFEGKNITFYTHRIRNKNKADNVFTSDNPMANEFMGELYSSMNDSDTFTNGLFLTVCYRPYALEDQIAKKVSKKEEKKKQFANALTEMEEITDKFNVSLSAFHGRQLKVFKEKETYYSEVLSLYQYLLTGVWQKVRVTNTPFYEYLGGKDIFFGQDSGQIGAGENARYFRIIEIKDYFQNTETGIFDALMYLPVEYIVTSSFTCLGRQESIKKLDDQIKLLSSNDDAAKTQIADLEVAQDMVASGLISFGNTHLSLMVLADTPEDLVKDTNIVDNVLKELGLITTYSTLSLAAAFFSQLPAVYELRPRLAAMSSLNYAEMESFHNFFSGKKTGAPWGNCVLTLKASGGGEYHLNYHHTSDFKNQFGGEPPLGHTDLIGSSNAGKTVFLMTQFMAVQQFGVKDSFPANSRAKELKTVLFDKDRAGEVAIRAMGGEYYRIMSGEPSGWNPFQLEPTKRNVKFLKDLIKFICNLKGEPLDPLQEESISVAVDQLMTKPREIRCYGITELYNNIPEPQTKEFHRYGIRARLKAWMDGGEYGWILDNEYDTFDVTKNSVFGIDGTEFLDDPIASQVITYYLLYRVTSLANGRRLVIYMDEFHHWIKNPELAKFVENIMRTGRKLNIILVFATQSPEELVKSPSAAALREQCATHLYMSNNDGTKKDYVDGLNVQPHHFTIIQGIDPLSRQVLVVKNAQRKGDPDKFSALLTVDLGDAAKYLPILSASKENLLIFEEIYRDGMKPEDWIGTYLTEVNKQQQAQDNEKRGH